MTSLDQIIENFSYLDEWEDQLHYVMELGKEMPDLPAEKQTAENKVQGCASQVWLLSHPNGDSDPIMTFEGSSDSPIVRGLVAIVLAIYSGKKASEIVDFDALAVFEKLNLKGQLTSKRTNGARAMINRIRAEAQVLAA